jgi:riboflavin synthase alpha subunit
MFTGLVEVLGKVLSVTSLDTTASGGGGFSIVIGECSKILEDVAIGDSIVCNGKRGPGMNLRIRHLKRRLFLSKVSALR